MGTNADLFLTGSAAQAARLAAAGACTAISFRTGAHCFLYNRTLCWCLAAGCYSGRVSYGSTGLHEAGAADCQTLALCRCVPAGAGVPLMAAGGGAGVVTVWDLEQQKLATVIRDAHDAPIVQLHFFPGELPLCCAGLRWAYSCGPARQMSGGVAVRRDGCAAQCALANGSCHRS